MNIKSKSKVIILIILIMISSCSVVFGRYVLESEKTEFANIHVILKLVILKNMEH